MELQTTCEAVEAHSCIDSDSEISFDEQYTTVDMYVFSATCTHSCKQLTTPLGLKVLLLSICQQLCIAHQVKLHYQTVCIA